MTAVEQVFRDEWGRVLAAVVGQLGDLDVAEEASKEAFAIAAERWPRDDEAGRFGPEWLSAAGWGSPVARHALVGPEVLDHSASAKSVGETDAPILTLLDVP